MLIRRRRVVSADRLPVGEGARGDGDRHHFERGEGGTGAGARRRPRHFYNREDVAKRVRELTGGEGVAVVYDGVGRIPSWARSTACAPAA